MIAMRIKAQKNGRRAPEMDRIIMRRGRKKNTRRKIRITLSTRASLTRRHARRFDRSVNADRKSSSRNAEQVTKESKIFIALRKKGSPQTQRRRHISIKKAVVYATSMISK
mmetsp:Transcript_57659/g.108651  ORF Transcript_57659/g.108651 Transcript_57659/m.108651 type:complete len:111 (+) Transcript_57659:181-513(+)